MVDAHRKIRRHQYRRIEFLDDERTALRLAFELERPQTRVACQPDSPKYARRSPDCTACSSGKRSFAGTRGVSGTPRATR